jgi:xanthine dehydrogenase accessory factor
VWSVSAAADDPPAPDDGAVAVDPICGMPVACVPASPSAVVEGTTHWFCGLGCRQAFLDPAREPVGDGAR